MKKLLIFLPLLIGIGYSEYVLWEQSGKKLESVFGTGVVNDQMAQNLREKMSADDLQGLLSGRGNRNDRIRIQALMEMAEKQNARASYYRKKNKEKMVQSALKRSADCYWQILEDFDTGYDIVEVCNKLNLALDPRDEASIERLTGILERLVALRSNEVNRASIIGFLGRLFRRLGNTEKERIYLEMMIFEEKRKDSQFIIDLVIVYLKLGRFDESWELYQEYLKPQLVGNDAVVDAALEMVQHFFDNDLTERALELTDDLYRVAESDQRRMQTASFVLRDYVKRNPDDAARKAREYKQDLTEKDWIKTYEGELWLLGFRESTEKPFYYIEKVDDGAITIDGHLDESCWNDNHMTDFIDDDGIPLDKEPVKAWLRYDSQHLYIAYHCSDPDTEHLVVENARAASEANIWRDDCVEIFLDVNRTYRSYYQFIVNTEGRKADIYNKQQTFDITDWQREVYVNHEEDYWEIEIAFEFKHLGVDPPVPGEAWYGNMGKDGYFPEIPGRPTSEFFDEYYYAGVWAYTEGDNHRIQNYGYLIFR